MGIKRIKYVRYFRVRRITWLKSWGAGVVSSSITVINELWISSKKLSIIWMAADEVFP